ncbi:MAG TPA: hypothetical protein VD837_11715 [Terriglobales bacterium]|nr:hypothetical protein [Terriglobales bacterium]
MPASKLTLAKRVEELERQLEELKAAVAGQAAKPASEVAPKAAAAAAPGGTATASAPKPAAQPVKPAADEGVAPEILAVIAAAVTHFLGKTARIRSARMVQQPVGTSPWAQQGRVYIQASHNLALNR